LTTFSIIQDSIIISSAQRVIDYIDEIKNIKIDGIALHRLKTSIQILIEASNSNLLRTFPVEIIDEPIDKVGFEIRSTSKLKFSEVPNFAIDSLGQAENLMDDTRCLDALHVLIDYCNIVVYSRFNYGLRFDPKKLDDWNSSSKISTHLANGEDSCIT
jgi:hypothetical protein